MFEQSEQSKPIITVPCAIIEQGDKIFAAQRNAKMSLPYKWEFPGGKVDEGETETEALEREIMEELCVEIEIGKRLKPIYKEDPHRIIYLVPYICKIVSTPIILTEHLQYKWVLLKDIYSLDWAEADIKAIKMYIAYREQQLKPTTHTNTFV